MIKNRGPESGSGPNKRFKDVLLRNNLRQSAQLKDKAAIVYPLEDFDYGMREFAIRDNNGYILQVGQEF